MGYSTLVLKDFKQQVLDGFFEQCELAEENRQVEADAATLIQSYYRMYIVKKSMRILEQKAVVIQSHFRAIIAKKRHRSKLQLHIISLRLDYFNQHAICIQKYFRAYMSRKYKHDFYARKEYIKKVTALSDQVVADMRENYKKQLDDNEKNRVEESQRNFEGMLGRLHHLISTQSCPSIFNSPYTALTGGPPTIAGLHVEDYLKLVRKQKTQEKPEWPSDGTVSMGMDKSFDESFAETKERFAGRTPVTIKPFISAGSSKLMTSEPTLRASTPYMSMAQKEAQAKKKAAKGNISHKPFVTAFRKGQLFEDTLFT